MRVIGILGGVASGKSLIGRLLAEHGAGVLDADQAGHAALRLDHVKTAAKARWGEQIFSSDGQIDRGRLAAIVFAPPPDGPRERTYLEQLTHPEIGRMLRAQIETLSAAGTPVAVLDAPVMLEAGWDQLCDCMIYVDVPRDVRLARARQRGWSEEEFTAREAAQTALDCKRKRADTVIDNSGSLEQVRRQVDQVWATLVEKRSSGYST